MIFTILNNAYKNSILDSNYASTISRETLTLNVENKIAFFVKFSILLPKMSILQSFLGNTMAGKHAKLMPEAGIPKPNLLSWNSGTKRILQPRKSGLLNQQNQFWYFQCILLRKDIKQK